MADQQSRRENAEALAILKWVDRIAEEYEAAWKSVKPPRVDDFVGDASGALRAALVEELLRIDQAYREQFSKEPVGPPATPPSTPKAAYSCATALCAHVGKSAQPGLESPRDPDTSQPGMHKQTVAEVGERGELKGAALRQARSPEEITVPGYEILGELGRGGMGVVYKARHLQLKRLAALKVILGGAHASADQLARFRREAGAAARLHHPNIVHINEIGEFGGLPYFALEFMDGGSLGQRLRASVLPPREAAQLVATLARAMQTAHEAGIIHRDLKPENVLLTSSGICKIADFGLAKQLDDDSIKTKTDAIIGTPSYMAPEQASGKSREIGPLSDVYALGAILYECLTGRPPFKAATAVDTLVQVRVQEPIPPRRLQPKVPRDLETICQRCLEKQPRQRYASAKALADDLERFLNNEPIQARRVRSWERAAKWMRRRPAVAALVGVLLTVGLVLPIAGLHYYAEMRRRWKADQAWLETRRNELRSSVEHLGFGDQTQKTELLQQRQKLVDALEKVKDLPSSEDLKVEFGALLDKIEHRLTAVKMVEQFRGNRDQALIYAFQATGEDIDTNRRTVDESAAAALKVVDTLSSSITDDEKAEITTSGCFLLLMLAVMRTEALSQNLSEQQKQEVLDLLKHAENLHPRTRAIHLCRARYWRRLGNDRRAAEAEDSAKSMAATAARDPQDHFFVGFEHYSQNKLLLATEEFRQALKIDDRHFWSHYFLGLCYLTASDPQEARFHLTICQEQQPELSSIYLLRGFALGQMKEYDAAESDFSRALNLNMPKATRYVLYNNRGVMRVLQASNLPLSDASAAALLGSPGGHGPLLGACAFFTGRIKHNQGIDDFNKATGLFQDKYEAWHGLAVAYQLEGNLEEALRNLNRGIEVAGTQVKNGNLKQDKLAMLRHRRALLHLHSSNRQAALLDFEWAARLAENDHTLRAQVQGDHGRFLFSQGRYVDALANYDNALEAHGKALKPSPGRLNVLGWRGEVLLAMAVELEGNEKTSTGQRNSSEAVQLRYKQAEAAFDAYLNNGGRASAAVYLQRGLACVKLERHDKAIEDFGRALDTRPTEKEQIRLHLYRGQEYLAAPAYGLALNDFEKVLQLDPENADAYLGQAEARVKLDDPRKAVADAERALQIRPKDPRLWLGAARVYAQAAAYFQAKRGQAVQQATIRNYEDRAVHHLRAALGLVPAGQQRTYWLAYVLNDKVLYPIGSRLYDLVARFGGRDR